MSASSHQETALSEGLLQFRLGFLNSAVNVGMTSLGATLCHLLFQVTVAERVGRAPARSGRNDGFFKSLAFEVDHAVI